MLSYLQNKYVDATGLNSDQLDLTGDTDQIAQVISGFDVVINATAFTDVNGAESNRDLAFDLNATAPEKLAKITSKHGQKLIHISTDYLFDGEKESEYETYDKPNPLNVYGESKLAGEIAVANNDPDALVIRTSWLYGLNGRCFPKEIHKKLQTKQSLSVVNDQFGTPTSTKFLAEFCYLAISQDFPGGIHHGVPTGSTSWFEFAKLIAKAKSSVIKPIQSSPAPGVALRPKFGQLRPHSSISKTWQETWDEAKEDFGE